MRCTSAEHLSPGVIVDALRAMAVAKVGEQTYLDVLLAQLLVVLRRDRASLDPGVLSSVAGSLGTLHEAGLSAKRGASGASASANRRCVEALGSLVAETLEDFSAGDLARTGGSFLVAFLDDTQRRSVLRRAADLEAGLRAPGSDQLAGMQYVERIMRQHSFAFIASLPDHTKDYLMKLKNAKAAQ